MRSTGGAIAERNQTGKRGFAVVLPKIRTWSNVVVNSVFCFVHQRFQQRLNTRNVWHNIQVIYLCFLAQFCSFGKKWTSLRCKRRSFSFLSFIETAYSLEAWNTRTVFVDSMAPALSCYRLSMYLFSDVH